MDIIQKGLQAEQTLKKWFEKYQISFLYIDQSQEAFAPIFTNNVKRPDFLMLIDAIGLIAVDVKAYTLSGGVYTLNIVKEFQKSIAFERIFRMPLWYAYKCENEEDTFYWISALKILEVGDIRKKKRTGDEFLAINKVHFEKITTGSDLNRLYNQNIENYGIREDFAKYTV